MSVKRHILTLDVGSTGVRASVYDKGIGARLISRSYKRVASTFSEDGKMEVDPEEIFQTACDVIRAALKGAQLTAADILSMGDKKTGKPLHPLIGWADIRCADVCDTANKSIITLTIRTACLFLYYITRSPRFLTMNKYNLKTIQAGPKFSWAWHHIPEVQQCYKRGDLAIGTLDSWLVYKFSGGNLHVTDYSNASATGVYDPYQLAWSNVVKFCLFPYSMPPWSVFPKVVPTAGDFGTTEESLFGHTIPINVVVADQSAALFGEGCFDKGDTKVTLGTGCFFNVVTGNTACTSGGGCYPLIAWNIGKELTFCMEGSEQNCGMWMDLLQRTGFVQQVQELEKIASEVDDSGSVYCVPALVGLGPPYWDPRARGLFIGINAHTSRGHIIRSALEFIAFRIHQIRSMLSKELKSQGIKTVPWLRCDGGVTHNTVVCQSIADIADVDLEVPSDRDMSSLGTAYMSGLQAGLWSNLDELRALRKVENIFKPSLSPEKRAAKIQAWEEAAKRAQKWHVVKEPSPFSIANLIKTSVIFGLIAVAIYVLPFALGLFGWKLERI